MNKKQLMKILQDKIDSEENKERITITVSKENLSRLNSLIEKKGWTSRSLVIDALIEELVK